MQIQTINGDTVEARKRAPRQSECLDYIAARTTASEADGSALSRSRAVYAVALDFAASIVTIEGVDDVAAWLDERVAWTATLSIADGAIAERLPAPDALGKSEAPRGS